MTKQMSWLSRFSYTGSPASRAIFCTCSFIISPTGNRIRRSRSESSE